MTEINGKATTAFEAGTLGGGNKTELNLGLKLAPDLTLNLHHEFKGGLGEQAAFEGLETKPQDLLVRGIYKDQWAAPILKQCSLSYAPVKGLTLTGGFDDVGRNRTTNGFKSVGLSDVADFSRNPSIPFFERPLANIFPGSNLSLIVEYARPWEGGAFRVFAAAGGGRKSSGLFGIARNAYANDPKTEFVDETAIVPILPFEEDGAFVNGGFYSLGADIGLHWGKQAKLSLSGNLSVRTFDDEEAKKTFNKNAGEAEAVLNPYVGLGLEFFDSRLSLFADYTWVSDLGDELRHQSSWRAGARGHFYRSDILDVAAQFGVAGVKAGQGAAVIDDQIVYLEPETEEIEIIGPEGPLTRKVSKGGGERSSWAAAGGLQLVWKPYAGGALTSSLNLGHIEDDAKLKEGSFFWGGRLVFEQAF